MGQAKARGSFEQRQSVAIAKTEAAAIEKQRLRDERNLTLILTIHSPACRGFSLEKRDMSNAFQMARPRGSDTPQHSPPKPKGGRRPNAPAIPIGRGKS